MNYHSNLPEQLNIVLKDAEKRMIPSNPDLLVNFTVYSFPQTWPDTAGAFGGGIAGQMITSSQTVVVFDGEREACVYFGGRFGYKIIDPTEVFWQSIAAQRMPGLRGRDRAIIKELGTVSVESGGRI